MLGLVNAIGAAEGARLLGARKNLAAAHGIQVPIPQAQREAKSETLQAVFPLHDEEEDQFAGPKGGFDSDQPPEAPSTTQGGSTGTELDVLA